MAELTHAPARTRRDPAAQRILAVPACVVPIFVFLHIPKTAGTTMRWVFNKMFGQYYHLFLGEVDEKPAPGGGRLFEQPDYFDDKLMLAGHIARFHPVVRAIKNRRIVFVSVLRDPVKRVVSYYDYLRHMKDHPLHPDVRGRSLLEAFSAPSRFRKVCENEQLRLLFGANPNVGPDLMLQRGNYMIAKAEGLLALSHAVSCFSGMPAVDEIPRYNQREEHGAMDIVLARDQPDFAAAVDIIRAANRDEYAFYDKMPNLLVTTPEWRTGLRDTSEGE